ncbi:GNAT family N-acetyltransferase [Halalkalibacter akibai]|uniref:Acetyltransferase n=1 Tax=Halalkalibacter akibai (strain ATCC 43226 / DSM 21942 / CIP 109018 / JCM 9157 / 1139) TaxID=1236973 RepID=W4QS99_HALA3|nr:GNAT family N-acetyltransferase [Halalkalibacter akibai]GAE34498.1 acetyltransferase [Halalkalibacter akibai JCM 9157]
MIRKATNLDLQMIQNHAAIVQQEATLGYMSGNPALINFDMMNHYKGEYYVIGDHQSIHGWILLGETPLPYEHEIVGMVLELYVLPQWRKHGYGKILMQYAIDFYKRKGFKRVQLNVFSGNPAKNLYDSLGFQDVSTLMERRI